MQAVLARIDAVNPAVNAYVTVAGESALAAARMATRALSRKGGVLPPLHGVASGHESYEDRGPLEPQQIDSTSLLAVVCPTGPGPPTAMIYGHATVDGAGDFVFLITVTDGGNGAKNDKYGIIVSNGYVSGQQPLQGGNINIR